MRLVVLSVVLLLALPVAGTAQPSVEAGRRSYDVCAGCHGFDGEGNPLVDAPRLNGLPSWYLERQMRDFAAGLRGAEGDSHGQRMAIMARAAGNERELADLLAYIATLPRKSERPTIDADAAEGGRRYAVCAACHGAAGEGNEALAAPPLTVLDDWYLVRQLRLYAEGLRGFRADDVYGQQMRAMAAAVADDQAQRDLAAYIHSLAR